MKIAHLILTHANPLQLKRLIQRLAHPNADFYIHVDLKTDIKPFISINSENIKFIKNRISVHWGAYSIVQATVNSFEEILNSNHKYDYINLLSGQDYPIKSTAAIHHFFENNPGKAFMHTLSVADEWQEAIPRLTKYHLCNYHFAGKHLVEKYLNILLPSRKMPNDLVPVGRSQWFTITGEHAQYIVAYLQENKNVRRFFELTWGSDEIVFQTILFNSIYQKDMINDNLRYIDWSEGKASPKTFTMADLSTLLHSGKLFARKFNANVDAAIFDELDKLLY
ncbi:beta-1,6-N-acetylglucosaminyltransferase [Emticicia sp. SJ17W-69]|uniref:beta-1,6-N-acetylglucosaminyltransferase n=1 Tax=Emticicia sp. SJ17W-69 TaxID=3421657 RepID=UPI003EBEEEB9